jgi:hypothetical protein
MSCVAVMSCVLCLCQVAQQGRVCDIDEHVLCQVAGIASVIDELIYTCLVA